MKKLVAWKEEPETESSVENVEMEVHTGMGKDEQHPDEEEKDESASIPVKRPTKKELDREEGRRGNERKQSKKITYYDVPGAPDSTPRVAYRPTVARGSYRPTGVLGYVDPEKEKEKEKRRERRQKRRAGEREKRRHERDEFYEHERKMSRLETSLHELYPTSQITRQECQEEEPISLYKKWSNGDIPIEKLLTDGVDQLSESELLAIIMGNGPKEFPTVNLMNNVLDDCANDLNRLAKKTVEELMCYRGIGKNRAISVVAACEFGKRFRKTAPEEKPVLKNALAIGDYMMPQLEDLDVEEFWALFFNPKHEMLRRVRICRGEVSENAVDPRNIMRFGVLYNATHIVTVHNHVSGNPSPTKFDSFITAKLTQAAEAVRMTMRDHIILGDGSYYSFLENKKL
ncbi:MAG: DNA repair protein RadC [Prevotella sp.]|nr:DNA repair protein RadC [Prevotella sp.]